MGAAAAADAALRDAGAVAAEDLVAVVQREAAVLSAAGHAAEAARVQALGEQQRQAVYEEPVYEEPEVKPR